MEAGITSDFRLSALPNTNNKSTIEFPDRDSIIIIDETD